MRATLARGVSTGVAAGVAALATAACGALDGDCVAIGQFAIVVTAQDSTSGAPAPSGTRAIARDGAYADTAAVIVTGAAVTAFPLATEREGTYDVAVEAPGYRPWSARGVRVTRDDGGCRYLRGVRLVARLQR